MEHMTKEKKIDPHLEAQWEEYQKNPYKPPNVDEAELKRRLIEELGYVSKMTVGEYTLYQKWCEIHERYPIVGGPNLKGKYYIDKDQSTLIAHAKRNIWMPKDVDDYLNLKPKMIYTENNFGEMNDLEGPETYNVIRTFSSTMKNNNNIGRNLNYIIMDEITKTYLGVVCISSDFLDLTPRDNYIGWSRDVKTQQHMINHTAIGSTIVPLQPLGFNYVGGKLLALLCLSDEVQEEWKRQYKDTLVSVTTTSLYGMTKAGGLSQYDNLKYWKKMGYSSGSVSYEPTKETIYMIRDWLAIHHERKYFEWYHATKETGQPYKRDHRNRSMTFAYQKLGIPSEIQRSNHQRGIYYSPLYDNTCEFLRKEIPETELKKSFDTSTEALTNIWKEKYARKRIESLKQSGRVSSETLFYDDICFMDWEETKAKYLPQVGR
jgi:hypothetical protein